MLTTNGQIHWNERSMAPARYTVHLRIRQSFCHPRFIHTKFSTHPGPCTESIRTDYIFSICNLHGTYYSWHRMRATIERTFHVSFRQSWVASFSEAHSNCCEFNTAIVYYLFMGWIKCWWTSMLLSSSSIYALYYYLSHINKTYAEKVFSFGE